VRKGATTAHVLADIGDSERFLLSRGPITTIKGPGRG
jgi:hypothetical protein